MKKSLMILSLATALLLTACNAPDEPSSSPEIGPASLPAASGVSTRAADFPEGFESLFGSYYTAQDEPEFAYIVKPRFINWFTNHVTPAALEGIENQSWSAESFARYQILDETLQPLSDQDLYTCTFSADGDRTGYIVVEYLADGPAIQQLGIVETAHSYDLVENWEDLAPELSGTGLDLSTATASRARVSEDEVIIFSEGGNTWIYKLASRELVKYA